ncbi:MAG: D-cysteine desulfhydrase, partial [Actinomycetota bacterium]
MPVEPLNLAHLPTPLERADRLGAALGLEAGRLFVKRDDCTGLAGGGNKARKLNYLCADALARGADVLVTGGGRQSNHVRMTIAAANRLGLQATVVMSSDEPKQPSGNVVLDHVLAPQFVWAGPLRYYPLEQRITEVCEELTAEGRNPYQIPIGGATPLGALGYVDA